jgi:hypothetical protein
MINNIDLIRNTDAGDLLENILVSSIATILVTRFLLFLTDYPMLGVEGIHIAHMLWGGLLMLFSIIILLSFLGKRLRILGSLIGGVGFGLFIDELGKFITSDNNYFYEPTASLLYLIFLGLFFLFRYIESYKTLTQKEYLMNALHLLEEAISNDMDKGENVKYREFLKNSGDSHYLTKQLLEMSEKLTIHVSKPSQLLIVFRSMSGIINQFLKSVLFQRIVIGIFILHFLISLYTAYLLIFFTLNNTSSVFNSISDRYIFVGWGEFVSTVISAILSICGVIFLVLSRNKAYNFFKYSLLVSILLTSFFSFYRIQFAALFGLFINVILLSGINNMISRDVTKKVQNTK